MDWLSQLLQSAIGQAGIIFIIAELLDLVLKRMGKRGVWIDLRDLMISVGTATGKAISGFIPGSQVEPVLADFLIQVDKLSDVAIDAIIKELENKKSGNNEE